ncbi:hypothetical protein FKM82_020527 [Ascaphus truei]
MCVSVVVIVGARGFRRWEGMGSRGHVVEGEEEINSDILFCDSGKRVKEGRRRVRKQCRLGGGNRGDVPTFP